MGPVSQVRYQYMFMMSFLNSNYMFLDNRLSYLLSEKLNEHGWVDEIHHKSKGTAYFRRRLGSASVADVCDIT